MVHVWRVSIEVNRAAAVGLAKSVCPGIRHVEWVAIFINTRANPNVLHTITPPGLRMLAASAHDKPVPPYPCRLEPLFPLFQLSLKLRRVFDNDEEVLGFLVLGIRVLLESAKTLGIRGVHQLNGLFTRESKEIGFEGFIGCQMDGDYLDANRPIFPSWDCGKIVFIQESGTSRSVEILERVEPTCYN